MSGRRRSRHPEELDRILLALDDRKAVDVITLDLRKLCDATDFFIIASGTSDAHVKAVAEHVRSAMTAADYAPHHVEGLTTGHWALLDFVDLVVHVFHPTTREFYQLERLWADAPRLAEGTAG